MLEEVGRAEQYIITEASPNELKLCGVMRPGHRQGGGVGGCSSGVVCENHIVGSEFSEGMRTRTLFEYPLGKPLESKLLNRQVSESSRISELFRIWELSHRGA